MEMRSSKEFYRRNRDSNGGHSSPFTDKSRHRFRQATLSRKTIDTRYLNAAPPDNEEDAVTQIEDALNRWGLDPAINDAHLRFSEEVKKLTVDCFNAQLLTKWDPINTSIALPEEMVDALYLLLEHNLKQVTKDGTLSTTTVTNDLIKDRYGMHVPFPPYYNNNRGDRQLSRAYKEIDLSGDELDPLNRFIYSQKSVKDHMQEQFGQEPGEEVPAHINRALSIYEAIHGNHACINCKKRGSLHWNSALRSDFCHIICNECDSAYTLCSVADSNRVHKSFDKRSHFRGSYAHFRHLEKHVSLHGKDNGERSGKMFLLFSTRSDEDSGNSKLPVFVTEITGAVPNLTTDSFDIKHIRIKSNVFFVPRNGCRPWYHITIPQNHDMHELSMLVFDSFFVDMKTGQTKNDGCNAIDNIQAKQINSIKQVLKQIDKIKRKQVQGLVLEKWEIELLGRENKALAKLEKIG